MRVVRCRLLHSRQRLHQHQHQRRSRCRRHPHPQPPPWRRTIRHGGVGAPRRGSHGAHALELMWPAQIRRRRIRQTIGGRPLMMMMTRPTRPTVTVGSTGRVGVIGRDDRPVEATTTTSRHHRHRHRHRHRTTSSTRLRLRHRHRLLHCHRPGWIRQPWPLPQRVATNTCTLHSRATAAPFPWAPP